MYQWMVTIAAFLCAGTVQAQSFDQPIFNYGDVQNQAMIEAEPLGLGWNVGDWSDYKIDMGFVQGTMEMNVREEVHEGFWVVQDIDLGVMGKQKAEILFDKNTGEILQLIVNGEKKDPPEPGDQEIIEMEEDTIEVEAGRYDVVYIKIKDNDKDQVSEAWINRDRVPISGMVQQKAPSQFGQITTELVDHKEL